MNPLLCQSDHKAWQDRVLKERTASHAFYRSNVPRTIGQISPWTESTAVPIRLNGPFDGRLGLEVRGKYARPVHYANGVFRIDSDVQVAPKRETDTRQWAYATWSGDQPKSATSLPSPQPRAHTAAPKALHSPLKPSPRRYASELQSLIKQERTVLPT